MTKNMKQALETLVKDLKERNSGITLLDALKEALLDGRITREDRRTLSACLNFLKVYIGETADLPKDDDRREDFRFEPATLMMIIRGSVSDEVRNLITKTEAVLKGDSEYDESEIATCAKHALYLLTIIKIVYDAFGSDAAYRSYCIPAMFAEVTHWEVPKDD